jgi:hypothetical protein
MSLSMRSMLLVVGGLMLKEGGFIAGVQNPLRGLFGTDFFGGLWELVSARFWAGHRERVRKRGWVPFAVQAGVCKA